MCDRCGFGAGAHAISLAERPAHRLVGWFWEGSHAQARDGAIKPVIRRARELSERSSGLWRSPIVGLTWNAGVGNDRPGFFRYFVGIAGDDAPAGGTALDLPEMIFASSWHGADDGGVVEHYMRMIEWIGDEGHARDTVHFAQREEYPNDYDPDGPLSLRLLLPVKVAADA
jgi:hypothetical protein